MYLNITIDIETLSTSSNALITQIGAVCDHGEFQQFVDIQNSMNAGFSVDASTITWWMKQTDEARKRFQTKGRPIVTSLENFSEWVETMRQAMARQVGTTPDQVEVLVWGNGAAFDNCVLSNAYRRVGVQQPWSYKNDRCYRTLKELVECGVPHIDGVAHDALDDARYQHAHLKMSLSKLNRKEV